MNRINNRQKELESLSNYLYELESQLSLVFAHSPDLIVMTDSNSIIKRVNHSVVQILGYTPSEMVGRSSDEFIHLDDVSKTKQFRKSILTEGVKFEELSNGHFFSNRWRRSDGTFAKLVWRFAHFDKDNRLIIKFASDFSYLLTRDPNETRLLVNCILNSSVGIVITDYLQPDNPIIFANDRFVKMSGFSQSDIIGKNCRFLNSRDREQESLNTVRKSIKRGTGCEVLMKNFRPDGEEWYNLVNIAPVLDDSQSIIVNYIGTSRDVTGSVLCGEIIWDRTAERGFGRANNDG